MQAKVRNSKPKKLTFPCNGMSSMLFLEYWSNLLSKYTQGGGVPVFRISKETPDSSEIESDIFVVEVLNIETYSLYECCDYINKNQ